MEWQDGLPLTARDVVFTYDLVLETQQPAYVQYLSGVTDVQAPDDGTVVITTRRPKSDMLGMAIPILPEHIWSKVDPDRLDEYENLPFVGSGPFRVTSVDPGKAVTLEPNPAYPQALGGPPELTRLTFLVGRDPASLLDEYRAGELDAVVDFPATLQPAYAAVPGTTTVAAPAVGCARARLQLLAERPEQGRPAAARRLHPPGRALGHRQGQRSSRRRWPGSPSPAPRCSLRPRVTGTGRCRRTGSTGTTPVAPSRSSRTPGTRTVTATASARTRPAASSRSGSRP